ncbi:hypothetical protein GGI09_002813 [Coemansia sp. S100]|nr:hypothetical protein GGI09_002813 [Coemansia sp. S100]KAJ2108584.1 hypothetical protein GGI16_001072 [Coemansia sp. S142-1]
MEPNNIYVLHQGDGVVTPKKLFLFVFPYSENLTSDIMCQHAISVFGERKPKLLDRTYKYRFGSTYNSVLQQGVEQRGSKKAIMDTYSYPDTTYLSVREFANVKSRWMASTEFTNLEGKMNELIKLYETLTADTPALKLSKVLKAKNIYYYDERKVLGSYTFDKRSPEGMEFIKAKLVVKREKLLTQRTHNANSKHRDQRIDASRQELQEEHQ